MSSFGGDFRLGRTAFVDPGKLRRRRRVRREDAAIKPLPAIILEPDEKSSNEQVRRPGYSDDSIHSQPWSPTPSTTAVAPELRTAKRSPATPLKYASPLVAPWRPTLPFAPWDKL